MRHKYRRQKKKKLNIKIIPNGCLPYPAVLRNGINKIKPAIYQQALSYFKGKGSLGVKAALEGKSCRQVRGAYLLH